MNLTRIGKEKKVKISSLRGMEDILPEEISIWQFIEEKAKALFKAYNYNEIRTPILEQAELFLRSIGEQTDIVQKEMYIFQDKKGRTVALRPEGTASVVRAYIEHSLFNLPQPQKFYYIGPMFRYERPQKGRQRQFHQIGVEAFGVLSPKLDGELVLLLSEFFNTIGVNSLNFEINSIGCKKCRPHYRESLVSFIEGRLESLCSDCKSRFEKNPLRVLDCKVSSCRDVLAQSPSILDFICEECSNHFFAFKRELEILNIPYKVNPKIVRGLDYYTKTVFEVTTEMLGAQNAVAAGGRYDDLVQSFGGPPTPAAGFAIGMERVVELLRSTKKLPQQSPLVYVTYAGEDMDKEALKITKTLRNRGFPTEVSYEAQSLKAQLKRADRFNVKWVIIVGEEEFKRGKYRWKNMKEHTQGEGTFEEIVKMIGETYEA